MITAELKRSAIETMEEDAIRQFNNAFDYQGWESDGVSIANVAHPLLRSRIVTATGRTPTGTRPTPYCLSRLSTLRIRSFN
jgi:hypothetical protein